MKGEQTSGTTWLACVLVATLRFILREVIDGRREITTSKLSGSINLVESGKTDNVYVNVWDFSTSQANGTIQSLALTNYYGGKNPFLNSSVGHYGSFNMNNYSPSIYFDDEEGDVYLYTGGRVIRKHVFTSEIPVYTGLGEEVDVFNFNFSNPSYSSWSVSYGYDGYLYAVYTPQLTSKGTATIRVRKVKISDLSFEESPEQSFQINNVTLVNTYYPDPNNRASWAVSCGYLYGISYDNETLYKINLSNTADVQEIKIDGYKFQRIFPKWDGGLYMTVSTLGQNSSGTSVTFYRQSILYPDGEYRIHETTSHTSILDTFYYGVYVSKKLIICRPSGNNNMMAYGYARDYLGTICNLSSPVVKTSAQSMKVTYTLTDVKE